MPEIPQAALEMGYWLFFVALPLALFFGLRATRVRSRLIRLAAAVLIPWILVQQYHLALVQPHVFKIARSKGDLMYDGTGASAAITIIGFVFPVLVVLPALGAELLIQRFRSRRRQSAAPHP
ncbi:MAG: hypothetical protein ACO1QR_00180 [Chthoniobacteraceae bacterium]